MNHIELTLTQNELKFLVDLIWGAPISIVKETAKRHNLDDSEVEGHLVKCLGYSVLQNE